jgi:protein SCO1
MTIVPVRVGRRGFLGSVAASCLPLLWTARSFAQDHGRIRPPVAPPNLPLIRNDGTATTLGALLDHRATALQVMFTACTTTCPIQGAIFERVQKLLPDQIARGVQLVSLSVDPRRDTAPTLASWLRRFHARSGWIAAAPREQDVEQVREFTGKGRSASDNHSTQVQILNREGLLVWRTGELPEAEEIAALLRRV